MRRYTILLFALPLALALTSCIETVYKAGDFMVSATETQPWKKLALDGDVSAQYKTAELYCCGERPRHDNVKALFWYCKAAKNGQRDAMLKVGAMYENASDYKGDIIPYNPTLAYVFDALALQNGNMEAEKAVVRMESKLTPAQMKEALELLESYPKIPCEIKR